MSYARNRFKDFGPADRVEFQNYFSRATVSCIATLDYPPKSETTFKDVVTMTTDMNRSYSMCRADEEMCDSLTSFLFKMCRPRFKVVGAARSNVQLSRFYME